MSDRSPTARPITTLLVANRGEIARRVLRAARDLGLRTVAVCSDPDRDEPFAREADVAVRLEGESATETYLDVERVVASARRAGADAVHPGYGFLSESPAAARAVEAAGLVWVGPPADVIARLGDKLEAKRLAVEAGVPTLPSAALVGDAEFEWRRQAAAVGYPLLVKAAAGGGGRGMRVVADEAALAAAVTEARREAQAAFGDPTVFAERHVRRARHVEVQIAADRHGNVVHLGERECSVQRRHQKIIEEAPSPAVDLALRARLGEAAVALARAVGYVTVGTVEFLLDEDTGDASFLEVNTRLQVEHPVTEAVTGIDLVALQLALATGAPLPLRQDDVALSGHAVEARVYAEDPARGWLPSSGRIHRYAHPPAAGVRHDDGVVTGSVVTTFYDPLLAKVIAHGPDRQTALARLARALDDLVVQGVTTNRAYLAAALRDPDLVAGRTTTTFVDDHAHLLDAGPGPATRHLHVAAAVLAARHRRRAADRRWPFVPGGWRNVGSGRQHVDLAIEAGGDVVSVAYEVDGGGDFRVAVEGPGDAVSGLDEGELGGRLLEVAEDEDGILLVRVECAGAIHHCEVFLAGDAAHVRSPGGQSVLVEQPRFPDPWQEAGGGGPTAPVPGQVVAVEVAVGDEVTPGRTLVIMEAMKVEHRITTPIAGIVAEVLVAVGDRVDAHQVLVRLETGDGTGGDAVASDVTGTNGEAT